ncbi:EVE domain-containing protein [Meiothermus sp. QL-1]|uniref:EVE domain-containing protein n=1 Tax=Meiothermus sp. QL-1 TaxID=2058095 RepID=UPI000E0A6487|nr:EVE domain-containing protein [Meiothermus sp. QL-1]RDI96585.1 EVE domain-containing protein [Meiothermus sp. QL-1]
MRHWLIKSEPHTYSIHDLEKEGTALWDGVRNYQARNYLRAMQVGDLAFFYHSNAHPPGIAGLCRVVETGLPDPSQFDPASPYFDPKSPPESPRWWTVRVAFLEKFEPLIPLARLREQFTPEELPILRRGNRLSVIPVEARVAEQIRRMVQGG